MKIIIKQLIKFGLVGITNVLVTYSVYYILLFSQINYLIANTAGYIAGIFNSYYWNNKYVFKNTVNNSLIKLIKVFVSYFITYIINTLLLRLFVQQLQWSKLIAPLIVILITIPINFLLNKFWAFKE